MRFPRAGTGIPSSMAALFISASLCGVALAQQAGAPAPSEPPPVQGSTDEGSWHGTWTYVNRNGRMILWIDESGETPQVRVQYQGISTPEAFATDWDGSSTYIFAGEPGTFEMKITEAGPNRIRGTWFWDIQLKTAGRSERGTFTIHRIGDGRRLVLAFSEYERVRRKGDKVSRYEGATSWNFRKGSKRIALWDEVF
jgi:hypothetical protein